MLAVAVFLLVVGVCDLLRAARDVTSARRRLLISVLGVLAFGFAGLWLAMDAGGWLRLGLPWILGYLLWVLGSAAALQHGTTISRSIAFGGLGLGLLGSVLGGAVIESDWSTSEFGPLLADHDPAVVLLVVGVLVVQLSTANVLVRMILDAVGVPATTNEKRLKGGRLLGPMERVFIVALGVAGQLTAAAVVVAAKGLLRFPELQRGSETDGPSDVTEYFLIGSFASWLVAIGGAALVWLGVGSG